MNRYDISLLDNVSGLVAITDKSKAIDGIYKLAQRYVATFLTANVIPDFKDIGTSFSRRVINGSIQKKSDILNAFNLSNAQLIRLFNREEAERKVPSPDDEILRNAELVTYSLDYTKRIIYLTIKLTAKSGDTKEILIPTESNQ